MTKLQQALLTASLDASSCGLISGTTNWAAFVATSIGAALAQPLEKREMPQGLPKYSDGAGNSTYFRALGWNEAIDAMLAAAPAPQAQTVAQLVRSDIDIHLAHCFQAPYETSCKYDDADCPATPKAQPAQRTGGCPTCGYCAATGEKIVAQPVAAQACNPLCELCVKRGYNFCANVAQTTPLPMLQSTQPAKTKQLLGKFDHLTDDEILTIAHRKATRYTHAVAPGQITYGFTVTHAVDFARAIEKASE